MANLPDWTDEQWAECTERLTLYALRKLARLSFRGVRFRRGGQPPGAPGPEDLAQEAVCAVINGDRTWDQTAAPDFPRFLEGVVDSKVSHLAECVENRRSRGDPNGYAAASVAADTSLPEDAVVLLDAQERFKGEILRALGDDPLSVGIFECLQAGFSKPAEMAELLGITVQDVNNAQKRYWRKVDPLIRRCIRDWQ